MSSRFERLLQAILNGETVDATPLSRNEELLSAIANRKVLGIKPSSGSQTPAEAMLLAVAEAAEAASTPVVQPLTIIENGTYTAPEGVDGYNPVTVNVEPVLQEKTITENGEYTPDGGFDGLGKVTVEVTGSGGGGSLPAGLYWTNDVSKMAPANGVAQQRYFTFNGSLYAITHQSASYKNILVVYKYENGAWKQKFNHTCDGNVNWLYICPIEYNGKIHVVGTYSRANHFAFDDSEKVTYANVPQSPSDRGIGGAFIDDGKLKYCANGDAMGEHIYVWDETTDTWTEEREGTNGNAFFNCNGKAYCFYNKTIYEYHNGTLTQFCSVTPSYRTRRVLVNGNFAYIDSNMKPGNTLYKINMTTGEETIIGKTPPFMNDLSYYDWVLFEGKIHMIGCDGSTIAHITMHEVTE